MDQSGNKQTVVVKRVVEVRKKRSLLGFLSATIFILSLFIVVGAFISLSVWLHTYKVFTQEKTVAEVSISKKYIKDGKPTFRVKYTPLDQETGFWGIIKPNSDDKEIDIEMTGDQLFVNSDFIAWKDWLTFINFKPVYKVNRLVPGYQRAEDYQKFGVKVLDLNGGPDAFATKLQEKPEQYKWLAKSVFISSGGVNVQNEDRVYLVKITEDALVLQPK